MIPYMMIVKYIFNNTKDIVTKKEIEEHFNLVIGWTDINKILQRLRENKSIFRAVYVDDAFEIIRTGGQIEG